MASPTPAGLGVHDELLRSRATRLRAAAVGTQGAWLVQWRNADTEAAYHQPGHHTLSLYLQGGEAVRCLDEPQARGAPDSLCCMPADHVSRWDVRGSLQLLHLYLPRLPLAEAAQRWFDLDPRWATLQDRIYFQDPVLSALGRRVAALDWDDTDAGLQLQQLSLQMQSRLLLEHSGARRTAPSVRGGLSPLARRRVLQRVEDARGAELSLRELADAACLSEFHFMRMFKLSFGMTPHMWVMQRRLAHARELLAAGRLSLQQVAAQAGYAHLSHLNAALRRAGLGTAARYRSAVAALSRQAPVSAS
jgi:AraC family transcriptional regulator